MGQQGSEDQETTTESGGGEPTRARGVSQASETDSKTTMILNQPTKGRRKKEINTEQADSRDITGRIRRGGAGDRQVRRPR